MPQEVEALMVPDAQMVVMETPRGKIVFELFPQAAPHHVERIKELARKRFYDGILFHRVIPGFMIQFGDPNTKQPNRSLWGQGDDAVSTLKAEFNRIPHEPGIVSMARRPDPDSASTQFFICVGSPSDLNGKYTVFGRVVEGMDVVNAIANVATDSNDAPIKDEKVTKVYLVKAPSPSPEAVESASPTASPAAAPKAP